MAQIREVSNLRITSVRYGIKPEGEEPKEIQERRYIKKDIRKEQKEARLIKGSSLEAQS